MVSIDAVSTHDTHSQQSDGFTRICFLPIPPMIFPEIATGASSDLDDVRAAALDAARWAGSGGRVGILTPREPVNRAHWSLSGFGVRIGEGHPVDLPEAVGRWLLGDVAAEAIGPGDSLTGFDGLLVMGDGSAARTEKAPGHIDARSIPFDDAVLEMLASGDGAGLAGIDTGLAEAIGAAGAPAWAAVGRATREVASAGVDVAVDPFGVLYVVARWTARLADPA